MNYEIPRGKDLSLLLNGVEVEDTGVEIPGAQEVYTDKLHIRNYCELSEDKVCDHRAAIYVDKAGFIAEKSVSAAVQGGAWDGAGADGVSIAGSGPDFSAVIVDGGKYTLKNAKIELLSDSDGKKTCDFAGLGSAVCAFNGGQIRVENCEICTEGVAKCTIVADDGSDVVVKDCKLSALGGELYEGYENSADFNWMVAPPWVLGIKGNARGTNLMGQKSSTVVVNTDVTVRNWGALSTDTGAKNRLTVADTSLTLIGRPDETVNPYHKTWGSGYGTYILGCDEFFYGVKMNVGTYIGIAREGNAIYRSSKGVVRAESPTTGEVLYEAPGKDNVSELNSDGFGIMCHGHADLTFTEGTVMNTESAAFLLRCGGINIKIEDGAQIRPADGVLVQIIDDDDATVGVNWDSPIELHFNKEFNEKPGWPSENGQISSMMPPPPPREPRPDEEPDEEELRRKPDFYVNFSAEDTVLTGDLLNGSGYYGQKAKQLYVTLGAGASLTGRISATETRHINEKGEQNTHFTIDEYYYLGRVENRNHYNGDNDVEVTLEEGSAWTVTGESILSKLTVNEGAVLNGSVTVDGEAIVPAAGKTYAGRIVVSREA